MVFEGVAIGLPELETRIKRDLEFLSYPSREWVKPRVHSSGSHVFDVVIVGGGQGGLACAFGLLREKVTNILVVDDHETDNAGPWRNFARMKTLRTPKYLTGPDLGIANLTPRSWYEAQHGDGSWAELGLLPKETWSDYLAWYRKLLGIPTRWKAEVRDLSWDEKEKCWNVPVHGETTETLFARRVVLATGIDGSGDWHVPEFMDGVSKEMYAHTRWEIDFPALAGKRVAILGAGASAFDNASTALEHGAKEVRLSFRREKLVSVNPYRWAEFVGFLHHHGDLPDAQKWKFIRQLLRMGQLPPKDTYHRATKHKNFTLHPSSAWMAVKQNVNELEIETSSGTQRADFVILGTGFRTNLAKRKELGALAEHIALWSDRFQPPSEDAHADLAAHPYLGSNFECLPKSRGDHNYLNYLYNYTFGCLLSLGFGGASISGMKYSIPRLVSGITKSLYSEDAEAYFHDLCGYSETEF